MAVLILAGIALQLLNPQILRIFIDTVTSGGGGGMNTLTWIGVAFIVVALAIQGVSIAATYYSENVAWTATNQMRADLVAHCLALDLSFHKERTAGELIEHVDGDVDTLSTFFSQSVIYLGGNFLLVLGIVVILLLQNWLLGAALALFVVIAMLILNRIRIYAVPRWTEARQQDAEFFGFLSEQLVGTEDVRANGATGYVMRRFYLLLAKWFPISRRATMAGYSMWITTLTVFALGNAMALALGGYLWSTHAISLGTVYLVFYYVNLLNDPLDQIRSQLQELQQAGAGIERVRQLLQTQPTMHDGTGKPLPEGALAVEFRKVTFGYGNDEPVLHDLNVHLQPGTVLGVLGRTGSGKTTLVRLLLRLYDVQQGEVRIGEVPVREATLRDLRQHIGMVTQDVQLFHATVRDNLTFFNRTIDDERILAVLADLGLLAWYTSLPNGLDTVLGSDGEGLSAGEAQLLAFTRVFLVNPGLVILDEASSRLDPATERLIECAVSKLLHGRTAIMIAHRLATVQRADEIMVLENGHIVEHGVRSDLAADADSRFAHLLQTGLEEVRA
jgi:ABC-type multidrug transport system fused ATPase/permease subunit